MDDEAFAASTRKQTTKTKLWTESGTVKGKKSCSIDPRGSVIEEPSWRFRFEHNDNSTLERNEPDVRPSSDFESVRIPEDGWKKEEG